MKIACCIPRSDVYIDSPIINELLKTNKIDLDQVQAVLIKFHMDGGHGGNFKILSESPDMTGPIFQNKIKKETWAIKIPLKTSSPETS